MSSPYPVLNNRPIDQWKVTELKDELRRRKLPIKGLKDDLVRRLDEALRNEMAMTEQDDDEEEGGNGIGSDEGLQENGDEDEANPVVEEHSDVVADTAVETSGDQKTSVETIVSAIDVNQNIEDQVEDAAPVEGSNAVEFEDKGIITGSEAANVEAVGYRVSKEDSAPESQSLTPQHEPTLQGSVYDEEHKGKCHVEDTKPSAAAADNQVSEVTEDLGPQVKCESISTDSVSINETNKLKDNSNADNFDLELEVKPEMVQPSSGDLCVGGDVHRLDVDKELVKKEVSSEEIDYKGLSNMDSIKKEDSADVGSPEKLNLDRSSGDESMDEDVTDSKPIESRLMSNEKGGTIEISEGLAVTGETLVEDIIVRSSSDEKDAVVEEETKPPAPVEKRKLEDKEAIGNNETFKRQRRWNAENAKALEPQKSNLSGSYVLKDVVEPTSKHTLTGPDKTISEDSPKERIVPPSQRPATTSLRIDRFVRPFTLKAVQELLAKTGSVCSFWMDHIKTHCYVTYSSMEEAAATRDAVYNLQWPPNNGNHLIAEFVDQNEVKLRVEAPPQSPAPVSPSPTTPKPPLFQQPETSQSLSRQQALKHKQQLPPAAPLPQPPLLSDPPSVRERLRPPPVPPTKHEPPPAVTLDDLFKKTKTGPRIYYLPLSEEQVTAKLASQGKSTVD
uniref:SAP domain-containing protein n=1 Tax=Ananas comosus var. bracteatus TaxID=296719 RepID=A0A6V7QWA4_ANACO